MEFKSGAGLGRVGVGERLGIGYRSSGGRITIVAVLALCALALGYQFSNNENHSTPLTTIVDDAETANESGTARASTLPDQSKRSDNIAPGQAAPVQHTVSDPQVGLNQSVHSEQAKRAMLRSQLRNNAQAYRALNLPNLLVRDSSLVTLQPDHLFSILHRRYNELLLRSANNNELANRDIADISQKMMPADSTAVSLRALIDQRDRELSTNRVKAQAAKEPSELERLNAITERKYNDRIRNQTRMVADLLARNIAQQEVLIVQKNSKK